MQRRTLLTGAAALVAAPLAAPISAHAQAAKTKIVLWHALTGANGEEINRLAREFNASQSDYELEAVFKGSYPETLGLLTDTLEGAGLTVLVAVCDGVRVAVAVAVGVDVAVAVGTTGTPYTPRNAVVSVAVASCVYPPPTAALPSKLVS